MRGSGVRPAGSQLGPDAGLAAPRGQRIEASNAQRHSGARTISADVTTSGEGIAISVVDDGWGAAELREGSGRRGIRERLSALGGRIECAIADGLGLSEGTVKNHVSTILSKFGVKSRTQAVLKGIELG
jgi:signal transduction histidine kinase